MIEFSGGGILDKLFRGVHPPENYLMVIFFDDITGRCVSELQADVSSAIESLEYYASLATTSVGRHVKLENGDFAYVTKEPYGIVAGSTPLGSNVPWCTLLFYTVY